MFFSQIEGAAKAIDAAAAAGWTSTLVCVLCVAMAGGVAWSYRKLSDRLTTVEDFQRDELMKIALTAQTTIVECTGAMREMTEAIKSCRNNGDDTLLKRRAAPA